MDIKKEREAFEAYMAEKYKNLMDRRQCLNNGGGYMAWDMNVAWKVWQAAKAQAVPEGRTDFEIINQTIELVDLLALSTNAFQRDPKSKVHPFESENPRVMEWWRTACQIQE
ncbi:MAG: hypothetical protein RSC68_35950, partial [Acinetobacter sp.]